MKTDISIHDFLSEKNLLDKLKSKNTYGFFTSLTEKDFGASYRNLSAKMTAKTFTEKIEPENSVEHTQELIFTNGFHDIISK